MKSLIQAIALSIVAVITSSSVIAAQTIEQALDEISTTLIQARLITDMNHDGEIVNYKVTSSSILDTLNNEDYPFYFWINDDDDEGEINQGKSAKGDVPGFGTPDHEDGKVDGMRDLVDFFPVFIDVKSALAVFQITEYRYRLRHADNALKFTETDLLPMTDKDNQQQRIDAILTVPSAAADLSSATVIAIGNGVSLGDGFLQKIQNDTGGIILVEASAKTNAPLILEIVNKNTEKVVFNAQLALRIDGVEKMYRNIDLKPHAVSRGDAPNSELGLEENIEEPTNNPDTRTENKYLAFVHGYNVSAQAARGWGRKCINVFTG